MSRMPRLERTLRSGALLLRRLLAEVSCIRDPDQVG